MKSKLIISTLLAVLFLTSCGTETPNKPQGEIKEVEISEEEHLTDEEELFKETENPFGYLTKTFFDPRASLSFEIPTDWNVEVKTGRLYQITAPSKDPYLPGFVLLLSHEYNVTDYIPSDNLYTLFSDELPVYTYRIDGENYNIIDLPSPENALDNPGYALKEDIVSLRTYSDVAFMKADKTRINQNTLNMINAYVNWPDAPTLFSCVFSPERESAALEMINYIISTMKKVRIDTSSETTYEIGGYRFSAYSNFIKTDSFLKTEGLTPISGLGVGIFKFSEETLESNVSMRVSRMISDTLDIKGDLMPSVRLKDDSSYLTGVPAKIYEGSSSFISSGNETSYYGSGGNIFFTAYFMERDGESHAIIVTWETNQMSLGEGLCLMIEKSLEYR